VALAPYMQPPYSIRLLGDANNYGILKAIEMLMGNASRDYVLFLEKDFQLIESQECVEVCVLSHLWCIPQKSAV